MNVQIRSMRDPGFWVPIALVMTVVVPVGIVGIWWAEKYGEYLRSLAQTDVAAAVASAMSALGVIGWLVCIVTVGMGGLMFRYFQLASREQRLPPSGMWSLGATHVTTGPRVRWVAGVGLGLSAVLIICGVGFFVAMRRLMSHFSTIGS